MVANETEKLQGDWEEIKGKLRKRWGQLTDNDLSQRMGDIDQLAGLIQRKTGEGREAIEAYLHEVASGASSVVGAAADRVKDYARQASESFGDVQKQTMDQLGAGYVQAQRFVRDQPGISLVVCFGAGLLTGLIIGMSRRA